MTSCLTFFSISRIRATSMRAFFRQTTGTFFGIQPRRAIASAAASSTSSQAA